MCLISLVSFRLQDGGKGDIQGHHFALLPTPIDQHFVKRDFVRMADYGPFHFLFLHQRIIFYPPPHLLCYSGILRLANPVCAESLLWEDPSDTTGGAMSTPLRVLIVDDSEDDALLLVEHLQQGGYKVTSKRVFTAESMEAALNAEPWDIVLIDYVIPGFSGLSALKLCATACIAKDNLVSGPTDKLPHSLNHFKVGISGGCLQERRAP
jgi:hypothetical protein